MRGILVVSLCGIVLAPACGERTGPDGVAPQFVPMNEAAPTVTITDLGVLGGVRSTAFAINEAGAIAGESETEDGESHAFLWQNGAMTDLGTLGTYSFAGGINARGQVVGASGTPTGTHLFLWDSGTMTDLELNDVIGANDISPTGAIVGEYFQGGLQRAFLWKDGVASDLGTLPAYSSSSAAAINPAGDIVGWSAQSQPDGNSISSAVLWSNGTISDLGNLGGTFSDAKTYATAINPSGQVVGASVTAAGALRAFSWQHGVMTDLGTLPGAVASGANAVSASGDIAGYVSYATGAHAALWSRGRLIDLGTLPGDLESAANGINSHGQIVGWSRNAVRFRAVLWTVN